MSALFSDAVLTVYSICASRIDHVHRARETNDYQHLPIRSGHKTSILLRQMTEILSDLLEMTQIPSDFIHND